jgi:hypothetical protein
MNGHSRAEILAFSITEITRRWPSVGDPDDAPVFVFATGRGSGQHRFTRRLTRAMADESALGTTLVEALAEQVVRAIRLPTGKRRFQRCDLGSRAGDASGSTTKMPVMKCRESQPIGMYSSPAGRGSRKRRAVSRSTRLPSTVTAGRSA